MNHHSKILPVFFIAVILLPITPHIFADSLDSSIKGQAVTGWNQRLGMPVTALRFVDRMMFHVNGVCGPQAASPIGINTLLSEKLCTYAAPQVYKAFFNVDVTDETPNRNLPLSDYPQLISHASDEGPLPSTADVKWFKKSNGANLKNYTVADWLKGDGEITFSCDENQSIYTINAEGLVPGGLYTLWGFYFDQFTPPPPDGTGGLQPDFAFGGTSANVFVADHQGDIDTSRAISFCPLSWPRNEQYQLVNLFLVFHSDGRVNATVGHTVATEPFVGPGVTALPQLMFALPEYFDGPE